MGCEEITYLSRGSFLVLSRPLERRIESMSAFISCLFVNLSPVISSSRICENVWFDRSKHGTGRRKVLVQHVRITGGRDCRVFRDILLRIFGKLHRLYRIDRACRVSVQNDKRLPRGERRKKEFPNAWAAGSIYYVHVHDYPLHRFTSSSPTN